MMKKILCLLLCVSLLPLGIGFAEESTEFDMEALAEDFVFVVNADDPTTAVLGLEKNADLPCYPASTTKIMTCILAIEDGILDRIVKVPSKADSDRVPGSSMGIHAKEHYSLFDLLYGMMLPSGNDAAIAIAIAVSGSVETFADRMNEKAESLGMLHTHFVNPNGLHDDNHYTTARDMALLAAYAMQNELFREIVSTREYVVRSQEGRKITVRSSNRFLRDYVSTTYQPESVLYAEAIGIKTGETNAAGKCLIAAAQRGNAIYIALLFHGEMPPSGLKAQAQDAYSTQRYHDAEALFTYAFAHDLRTVTLQDLIDRGLPQQISKEHDSDQELLLSSSYCIEWNGSDSYTAPLYAFPTALLSDSVSEDWVQISWDSSVRLSEGAIVGKASVEIDGNIYFSAPIRCVTLTRPTPPPTAVPTQTPILIWESAPFTTSVPTSAPPDVESDPSSWWLSCAPKGS